MSVPRIHPGDPVLSLSSEGGYDQVALQRPFCHAHPQRALEEQGLEDVDCDYLRHIT